MKIKRILSVICFVAMGCANLYAQEATEEKVEFNPHGYIQLQGGVGYTLGEADFSDLISPAFALSFGYQIKPTWGLRLGVSGYESRGGWVNPPVDYGFNYIAANLDAVFNLSNLICGYNPNRFFNLNAFIGAAVNYACNNDEAFKLSGSCQMGHYELPYLWTDNKIFAVGRAGLIADFRLSERLSLNLEANANMLSDHYNSKRADNSDWYFNALAGVCIRLGKPTKKVIVTAPQPTEIIPVKKEEPVKKVQEKPVVKQETVVKQVEEYRCELFFAINSSVITSEEAVKVKTLAEYLQKHPETKVEITGYADVQTGNPDVNMRLSKERAEKVAELLTTQYGIESARILKVYKGDTEQPFSENVKNRVCICLAK